MKIDHTQAFTITELIIASMVVGIIMLGIVTSQVAIQRNSKDLTANYFVIQKTSTILNHMLTSAGMAIGMPSEPGIVGVTAWDVHDQDGVLTTDPGTGDPNTFCIHQNVDSNSATWPGDINPSVHRWLCYTWMPSGGNAYNIYWCSKLYNTNIALNGAAACTASDHFLEKATSVSTKFSISNYCSTTPPTPCDVPQKVLFEATIENCLDPSTCDPSNISADNPYVKKTGNISPPAHSAG